MICILISCQEIENDACAESNQTSIDSVLLKEVICSCFNYSLLTNIDLKECILSQNIELGLQSLSDGKSNVVVGLKRNIRIVDEDKTMFEVQTIDCVRSEIESSDRMISLVPADKLLDENGVRSILKALVSDVLLKGLDSLDLLVSVERVAKPAEKRRVSFAKVTYNEIERVSSGTLLYESHIDTFQRVIFSEILEEIDHTQFMSLYGLREVAFPIVFFEKDQLETWQEFSKRIQADGVLGSQ